MSHNSPHNTFLPSFMLRLVLVSAQVLGALGVSAVGIVQPAALESLVGAPQAVQALTGQPNPVVAGSSSITLTKSVIGSTQSNFMVNIVGPSYPAGAQLPIISGTQVITGLVNGVYTVTETSPGAGWSTVYTAGGVSSSTNAVVTLTNPNIATATSPGTITGAVYNDLNADGTRQSAEAGVSNVVVTAYDRTGAFAGSATTNASGAYTLITSLTGPYRLEFTSMPFGFEPSRVASGTQNGTSTQFVNAPASNVNFALSTPSQYCQSNPTMCTSLYVNGLAASNSVLNSFPYNSSGTTASTSMANGSQVGSTWGLAWQRTNKSLFASALLKRHMALGPLGIGGIYRINMASGSPVVSNFVDVNTIGISPGTVSSNAARNLPSGATTPNNDASVYGQIGKVGLGDLDISDNDRMLWLVNLNTRTLHSIVIDSDNNPATAPTAGDVSTYTVPDPGCTGGTFRPFGLKYYRGAVYVGGVCDAQTSGSQANLQATVYRFDGSTFTPVLTFPLNYTKGYVVNFCPSITGWYSWSDTFPPTVAQCRSNPVWWAYPQPILSGIEFDADGSMILGFIDRFGNQMGYVNYPTTGTSTVTGMTGGDILRAYNNNGTFVLESNGTAGPNTTAGANNGQGIGNGEYYLGEQYLPGADGHRETSSGGLAILPGTGEVALSSMDPQAFDSGGVIWLSNTAGTKLRSYQLYAGTNTGNGFFGKAHGVGDLELLCDSAPIEIGNRVWNDLNGDGIQDPGESGINSVQVSLRSPTTTFTVNTSSDGNYYFAVAPNMPYTISVAAPSGYTLTLANANSVFTNHAISDTRDSDAYLVSGVPSIYYTTGSAGQNNHGLDFGFSKPPPTVGLLITNTAPAFIPAQFGDRVWIESDSDGLASTGSITPVAGMLITATDGTSTYNTTTNAQGYYSFSVPAGTYTVTYGTAPSGTMASATPGGSTEL